MKLTKITFLSLALETDIAMKKNHHVHLWIYVTRKSVLWCVVSLPPFSALLHISFSKNIFNQIYALSLQSFTSCVPHLPSSFSFDFEYVEPNITLSCLVFWVICLDFLKSGAEWRKSWVKKFFNQLSNNIEYVIKTIYK